MLHEQDNDLRFIMHNRQPHKQTGFSLLEVLITLVLSSITILGLMQLQTNLVHGAIDNAQRSIGIFIGHEILDRMRANPTAIPTYAGFAGCPAVAPAGCAAANDCNNAQIATRDLWEVMCDAGGVASNLSNLNINLTCGGAVCTNMRQNATLTLSWNESALNGVNTGTIVLGARL